MARLGLEPDWRCVWANDVSEKKAQVYRANFGEAEFRGGDVCELDSHDLPDAEMAWASFPCQDLSLAGWRRGMSGSRSGVFWAFWRLMQDLHAEGRRPPLIVLENVVGLLHSDFSGLCEALTALDLRCGALVMDAKRFTAQSRPRVFVVAVDSGAELAELVAGTPSELWSPTALLRAARSLPPEVAKSWVWWRLPAPAAGATLADVFDEGADGWFSQQEVDRLIAMMTPSNREKLEAAAGGADREIGFLYRRTREGRQRAEVRFDGLAGCLRTPAGGSSRQTLVVAERGLVRMRLLSAREAARLMGVPEEFQLPERYNDAYRAMGDGVAAPVVRWLKDELLNKIADRIPHAAAPLPASLRPAPRPAAEWLERKGLDKLQNRAGRPKAA